MATEFPLMLMNHYVFDHFNIGTYSIVQILPIANNALMNNHTHLTDEELETIRDLNSGGTRALTGFLSVSKTTNYFSFCCNGFKYLQWGECWDREWVLQCH